MILMMMMMMLCPSRQRHCSCCSGLKVPVLLPPGHSVRAPPTSTGLRRHRPEPAQHGAQHAVVEPACFAQCGRVRAPPPHAANDPRSCDTSTGCTAFVWQTPALHWGRWMAVPCSPALLR